MIAKGDPVYYRARLYAHYASNLGTAAVAPGRTAFYDQRVVPRLKGVAGRIVELGCGRGDLLAFLAQRGFDDVAGVDTSPEQVALAQERNLPVHQGDAVEWLRAQADASLGAVLAFDVLEHLTKNEALDLLDQVHRALRPGGRFVAHTVNAESPFFGTIRYGDFTHENAFTAQSLTQVLRAVGFQRTESYEDAPVVHGAKSLVRSALWAAIRNVAVVALAAETGSLNSGRVLTQNFLLVADKAGG